MATTIAVKTQSGPASSKKAAAAPMTKSQVYEVPLDANAVMAPLTHAAISWNAVLIWQTKGCPVGRDMAIWCEAEAQLKAERMSSNDKDEPNRRVFASACSTLYNKLASA